jgi:hypothetical protein
MRSKRSTMTAFSRLSGSGAMIVLMADGVGREMLVALKNRPRQSMRRLGGVFLRLANLGNGHLSSSVATRQSCGAKSRSSHYARYVDADAIISTCNSKKVLS